MTIAKALKITLTYPLMVISLCLIFSTLTVAQENQPAYITISDQDKAQIIRIVLTNFFGASEKGMAWIFEPQSQDYDPCLGKNGQTTYFLSSKNVNKKLLPKFDCIELKIVSSEEIKELSKTKSTYIEIEDFHIENSYVIVSISSIYMNSLVFCSQGFDFKFVKENGRWVNKEPGYHTAIS
jgi:hypothetical protein